MRHGSRMRCRQFAVFKLMYPIRATDPTRERGQINYLFQLLRTNGHLHVRVG
jgi:hypothetical protein